MNVTVIGMGKIGLPLAVNFARNGAKVIGVDVQEIVVDQINTGIEPFPGEKDLDEFLKECVDNGSLAASLDKESSISNAAAIVVCIPLIIDVKGEPDFGNIDELAKDIGLNISLGALICFETTLPVGTTRNRFTVAVEAASGLKVGKDFYVVFSPERVLTGRVFQDLKRYPKLVGGVTEECTKQGVAFYSAFLEFDQRHDLPRPNGVWALKNAEAAEFAKVAETTYRDVNIGLANEFAVYAAGVDVDILEVIEASNSQPYSHIHTPGISVGGHCIPVYPHFYIWKNPDAEIVTAARNRNLDMPLRAISQIEAEMGNLENLKIGIFGITYRAGVKESAFSGALDLLKHLKTNSAIVFGLDPFYDESEILKFGFHGLANLSELDGVILHTNHPEFSTLDFEKFPNLKFIYDGRRSATHLSNSVTFKYLTY